MRFTPVAAPVSRTVGGAIVHRLSCRELAGVKKWLQLLVRWTWIVHVSFCAAFLAVHALQRTAWFKERVYQMLVTGDEAQRPCTARNAAPNETSTIHVQRSMSSGHFFTPASSWQANR